MILTSQPERQGCCCQGREPEQHYALLSNIPTAQSALALAQSLLPSYLKQQFQKYMTFVLSETAILEVYDTIQPNTIAYSFIFPMDKQI